MGFDKELEMKKLMNGEYSTIKEIAEINGISYSTALEQMSGVKRPCKIPRKGKIARDICDSYIDGYSREALRDAFGRNNKYINNVLSRNSEYIRLRKSVKEEEMIENVFKEFMGGSISCYLTGIDEENIAGILGEFKDAYYKVKKGME